MKIKVNDNVLVIAGKNKGKAGKVMRVFKKNERITVEKVNIRTRHIKKTAQQAGQRIQYEAPFAVSNVKLICPNCQKAVRVGYALTEAGKKFRVCKKCKESVEQNVAKPSSNKK